MLELADTLIRGAAIAAQLLIAVRFAGDRFRDAAIAALAVGLALYLYLSSPWLPEPQGALRWAILPIVTLNPLLLWLACVALFDDEFRLDWRAAALTPPLFAHFADPALEPIRFAAILGMSAHIVWVAVATAPGDLVAARRRFRRWFFAAVALTAVAITGVETFLSDDSRPLWLAPVQAGALGLLAAAFLHWATRAADHLAPQPTRAAPTANSAEDRLLAALQAAMEEGVWRTEGLTVGQLANRLGAPEHQLRRVINQRLGHRNFAAFINARRIAAARAALEDPAQADRQILTIAHESGFASLGPFNRAFRAETGMSPSAYRAAHRS